MKRTFAFAAAVLIVVFGAALAHAASAGHLDGSFGKRGFRIVRGIDGGAGAVDIGRKGRIVIAGRTDLARLRPDGRLDRGFGDRGIATLAPKDAGERYGLGPSSLAIRARGGVFAAGRDCSGGTCEFAVTNLRRDGHLRRAWGEGGTARIGFGTGSAQALAIAIARGGKLIVAGTYCESRDHCHLAIARLDRNGALDQSFGEGGRVADALMCTVGGNFHDLHNSMALDPDGRIVVGGPCRHNTVSLARYGPSGRLDPSFGNGGLVSRHVRVSRHAQMRSVRALAIDSRKRIVVAGDSGTSSFAAARFGRNGNLDRSFGTDGATRVRIRSGHQPAFPYVTSLAIDTHGRIVVAGSANQGFAFVRFERGGKVDRRFGRRGQVVIRGKTIRADSVATDRRDRVVGAGGRPPRLNGHPVLVRLLG